MAETEIYIRVECFNANTEKSMGGYVSAIVAAIAKILDCMPDDSLFAEKAAMSDDPEIRHLLGLMSQLCYIPKPQVYVDDKANHYCLYTLNEFESAFPLLEDLENRLLEQFDYLFLRFHVFELSDADLVYKDVYQAVIHRDVYFRFREDDYSGGGLPLDMWNDPDFLSSFLSLKRRLP